MRVDISICGGDETILVVDDEAEILLLTERILKDLGYRVYTAPDGYEAVRLAESLQERIDVILLDLVMPNLNGYEAFPLLSAAQPDAKILFYSGYVPKEPVRRLIETGQAGYLPKGRPLEEMASSLRMAIDMAI